MLCWLQRVKLSTHGAFNRIGLHNWLSVGIENGVHWSWPSRSFWPFWLRIIGNSDCSCDNSSQILARITKFAPNMHLGILKVVLKMGVINLDLQGHLAISTQETAFNVALVYWSRLAKGCYTSQTCSCLKGGWWRVLLHCKYFLQLWGWNR